MDIAFLLGTKIIELTLIVLIGYGLVKSKLLKLNLKKLKMLLVQVVKLSMKSLKKLVLKLISNKMVMYLFLHLKLKELIKQLKLSKILLVKQKLVKSI